MLPIPPNVTPKLVEEVIAVELLSVKVPASLFIRTVADSVVIVPPQVLSPLMLRSVPTELTPAPRSVSGKAPTAIPPSN